MGHNIGTRMHHAVEAARRDYPEHELLNGFMDYMDTGAPRYVLDKEMMSLFDEHKAQDSVTAMMEAGVGKLPFPVMTIELWAGLDWRYFILLADRSQLPKLGIHEKTILPQQDDKEHPGDFEAVLIEFIRDKLEPREMQARIRFAHDELNQPCWRFNYNDHIELKREYAVSQIAAALNIALLMGHMSDLEREVIEPTKLNKARARNGKSKISTHTYVRIGHVYDRSGKRIKLTDANRRTMPIHMRAGHTRRQPHGQDWMEAHPEEARKPMNTETHHIVYVPPVLVNFKDGSELPLPKPKIVRL